MVKKIREDSNGSSLIFIVAIFFVIMGLCSIAVNKVTSLRAVDKQIYYTQQTQLYIDTIYEKFVRKIIDGQLNAMFDEMDDGGYPELVVENYEDVNGNPIGVTASTVYDTVNHTTRVTFHFSITGATGEIEKYDIATDFLVVDGTYTTGSSVTFLECYGIEKVS